MRILFQNILLLSLAFVISCETKQAPLGEEYHEALEKHRQELKDSRETTWLALTGFFLLQEGEQTIGSDSSADIGFPRSLPEDIMKINYFDDSISYIPLMDTTLLVNGKMFSDRFTLSVKDSIPGPVFSYGNYEWWVRAMGEELGIRLKSNEREELDADIVDYFPTDRDWIKLADFRPAIGNSNVQIQNSIGATVDMEVMGKVVFSHLDKEYSLDVFDDYTDDDKYFLIVGDDTNGKSTYGAGRYAYFPIPEGNTMELDFNYLYSPPCAFTEYATCPFPPPQNRLSLVIEAGEMFSDG